MLDIHFNFQFSAFKYHLTFWLASKVKLCIQNWYNLSHLHPERILRKVLSFHSEVRTHLSRIFIVHRHKRENPASANPTDKLLRWRKSENLDRKLFIANSWITWKLFKLESFFIEAPSLYRFDDMIRWLGNFEAS